MPQHTNDNDLQALFAAMREEEARQALAFEPFWDDALARAATRHPRRAWMRYAAAAALLIGLVGTLLLFQPREALSITEWQSPTMGLLPPAISLLDPMPLPTSTLLTPPQPRPQHGLPSTRSLWPDNTANPNTENNP